MADSSALSSSEDNASLLKPASNIPHSDRHAPSTRKPKVPRPRWLLHIQAQIWRFLMGIGMFLHRLAPPHPPKPDFIRSIQAKLSGKPGQIDLLFYTPSGYDIQKRLYQDRPLRTRDRVEASPKRRHSVISQVGESIRRKSGITRRWGAYPVVINFHGGGFTLGTPYDDARWCGTVADEVQALVVSVDYRLAPEHPFPTAVEDGVDALVWVYNHAEELGIDPEKIALSGFSSGGNMTFTVPLRLWDEVTGFARDGGDTADGRLLARGRQLPSATSSTAHLPRDEPAIELVNAREQDQLPLAPQKHAPQVSTESMDTIPPISIKAIIPWYPSLDYTRTRERRRATSVRKDQDLPAIFTDLFGMHAAPIKRIIIADDEHDRRILFASSKVNLA